jgi:hypothetical protein
MIEHLSEQFEHPLPSPLSVNNAPELPSSRPPRSFISLLNEDCLSEVFHHLAIQQLVDPPKFAKGGPESFLSITSQTHQNLDLLTCCLVSKWWYPLALRAYYYKLIIRVTERERWYEGVPLIADGKGRHWVKSMVLVGGGSGKTGESPVTNLWELFPNLVEVEVFGLGWSTGSLLCPEGLERVARMGVLASIKRLEVTATSEYLLSDMPTGKNFLDIQGLLIHLPNLHRLVLRGFNYRLPLSSQLDTPAYQIDELLLEKCSLSLAAFRWLLYGSSATLAELNLPSCSIWNDKDGAKVSVETTSDDEVEIMARRLGVEIPLFSMARINRTQRSD